MWIVETLDENIDEQLASLPPKIQAKMLKIIDLLVIGGNEVKEPHTKSLGNSLFEIRAKGEKGIARAFFTFKEGKIIIIFHIFIKKSQKTPKNELDKALKILSKIKDTK